MSTRGSGSFQFQKSLPQCESSFCRNGAVRATTQTSAAPLGSVSDVKCLDHDANLKYLMRGKAGQRTGSDEHKCKHVNARYVHTDTSNIRSMIHILQIHNLCCCRLQQRQVEDQCAHKSIQRTE